MLQTAMPVTAGPSLKHDRLVALLRAAGETTRLRTLALLAAHELTVKDLTLILGQSQPRVSRHLKLLADAGLVMRSAEGAFAFYRLHEDASGHRPADAILSQLDLSDPVHARDRERSAAIRQSNADAAAAFFAANAAKWDRIRSLHAPEAEVEATIRRLVSREGARHMLDVGTGTGRMLELLADRCPKMVGIDASAAMLSVARANLDKAGISHARLAQDDVYALSFPRDHFDLVVIHQVLHFLDDPARALAEAARTLRPSGHMIIVDFAPHTLEQLRTDAAHRRLGISREDMDGWLRAAGLVTDTIEELAGGPDALTVTLWLARDPRTVTDDLRLEHGAFA